VWQREEEARSARREQMQSGSRAKPHRRCIRIAQLEESGIVSEVSGTEMNLLSTLFALSAFDVATSIYYLDLFL
jgi:hypothetical protein